MVYEKAKGKIAKFLRCMFTVLKIRQTIVDYFIGGKPTLDTNPKKSRQSKRKL